MASWRHGGMAAWLHGHIMATSWPHVCWFSIIMVLIEQEWPSHDV